MSGKYFYGLARLKPGIVKSFDSLRSDRIP